MGECSPVRQYGRRRLAVHRWFALGAALASSLAGAASASPRAPLIWAFGDSLAAGYGLPPAKGFAALLQAALRREGVAAVVRNGGVAGDTAAQGRARLRWGLRGLGTTPDLVIVELGANDMLRGLPVAQALANLDMVLAELERRHIPVLLAGMRAAPNLGPDYARRFEAMYPALARTHRVPLYPFFLDGVAGNRALIQRDGLHPNERGGSDHRRPHPAGRPTGHRSAFMNDDERGRPVPSGRLSRLGRFGRIAGGVAGGMIAEGARRVAAGERPRLGDLILTPANVGRVADQLAHLRGAAMKLGQMISMDAGDALPPELSAILARLRSQAHRMPPQQLDKMLKAEWGADWRRRFRHFEAGPIAAASIGQVHRATLPDGRVLAVKVQYPGVRDSIAADVDNVATLLRLSTLLPPTLDLGPLLAEAKRQLAEEADYRREGAAMRRYRERLADDPRYVVPAFEEELTTDRVLAMEFIDGQPVETLVDAPQETRDAAMTALFELVVRELFEFRVMQTDPNFANYRWQPESGRLVLLDFGATRAVPAETSAAYRSLLVAGLARDRNRIREIAVATGFLGERAAADHRPAVDRIIAAIDEALNRPGPFDFGDRVFVPVVKEEVRGLIQDRATWHVPDVETLFVQRKVSGTALLAARLKARVDVRGMAEMVAADH